MNRSNKALAMINMLIFFVLFSILASVLLSLLSSHTRFIEADVRRIKGYYASEAASISALDYLRRNVSGGTTLVIPWILDRSASPVTLINKTVSIATSIPAGPNNIRNISTLTNHSANW